MVGVVVTLWHPRWFSPSSVLTNAGQHMGAYYDEAGELARLVEELYADDVALYAAAGERAFDEWDASDELAGANGANGRQRSARPAPTAVGGASGGLPRPSLSRSTQRRLLLAVLLAVAVAVAAVLHIGCVRGAKRAPVGVLRLSVPCADDWAD